MKSMATKRARKTTSAKTRASGRKPKRRQPPVDEEFLARHREILANPELLLINPEKPPGKKWWQLLFYRQPPLGPRS
jgi:hypothetical protein